MLSVSVLHFEFLTQSVYIGFLSVPVYFKGGKWG